jgi:Fic family protein
MSLIVSISETIGQINAMHLYKPTTELRKKNRIKTIKFSLEIEGNSLSEEQVTALIENKRILAPEKDIIEVQNAIKVYELLNNFNPFKLKDLEKAHEILMQNLIEQSGKFRSKNVGIVKGSKLEHLAPDGSIVLGLMKDLFDYLKNDTEIILIKSCVFHYEFEFIHPFLDGNGRMGRLWQTLILKQLNPIFEFLPIEKLIKKNQKLYYSKLSESDKIGNSTPFIEFMLELILESLNEIVQSQNQTLKSGDRILLFKEFIGKSSFTRKDYLVHFKNISAPTASRDLKWATDLALIQRTGDKNMTKYSFN